MKEWWVTGRRPDGTEFSGLAYGDTTSQAKEDFAVAYPGCEMTWGMLVMEHGEAKPRLKRKPPSAS